MPRLIVLLGPTGVGKTDLSLRLARLLDCPILSADSRQIYKDIPIGTAAPSLEDRATVPHFFVGTHELSESYSAASYEEDVLTFLSEHFVSGQTAILSGGSMMYIDAVCRGIDYIPDVKSEIRQMVYERFEREGLGGILRELEELDSVYYHRVDKSNYKRVLHGYEVCLSSGQPFSSFHTGRGKKRAFEIIKIGLNREREELYARINQRVCAMVEAGLEAEARRALPYRESNALNTVGYKEMFAHFDGLIDLKEAIRQIQRNSRQYARKQLTWWRKDRDIRWFHPEDEEDIIAFLREHMSELSK